MSDENDSGDERVTMPFKFVTGNWYVAGSPSGYVEGRRAPEFGVQANSYDHTGFDARFPNMNQTKHCWQNYVDYHKCIIARGEEFPPCRQFFLAFKSLCPGGWVARWDDQRENGTFPTRLDQ